MGALGLTIDPTAREGGSDASEMLDADVVMLERMLELLGEESKNMILEFRRAQNMRLLPRLGKELEPWVPTFDTTHEYDDFVGDFNYEVKAICSQRESGMDEEVS